MKLCGITLSVVTICLMFCSSGRTSNELYVSLPNGSELVGRYLRSHDGKGIRAFMGVPHAEPPVGDLRFREWDTNPMIPFPPVVEPDLPGAFITKHPRDVYEPHALLIPWMTGLTSDEGAMKSARI